VVFGVFVAASAASTGRLDQNYVTASVCSVCFGFRGVESRCCLLLSLFDWFFEALGSARNPDVFFRQIKPTNFSISRKKNRFVWTE
jgi:hypothetical protein